jgi:hypothetical protein
MAVENMPDGRLVRFYENIRQQVEADRRRQLARAVTQSKPAGMNPAG